MKVLDLQCAHRHAFEGWFGSQDDFDRQLATGLLSCPVCGNTEVARCLSAPRLNLGAVQPAAARADGAAPAARDSGADSGAPVSQSALLEALRTLVADTEDVGPAFAAEARRIHRGEADERAIRGQATRADAEALRDEGIAVVALPFPVPPAKGSLH